MEWNNEYNIFSSLLYHFKMARVIDRSIEIQYTIVDLLIFLYSVSVPKH